MKHVTCLFIKITQGHRGSVAVQSRAPPRFGRRAAAPQSIIARLRHPHSTAPPQLFRLPYSYLCHTSFETHRCRLVENTHDTLRPQASHASTLSIMCGSDIFLGVIAILFPPIAVWVKRGLCSADSLINIALCSTFSANAVVQSRNR